MNYKMHSQRVFCFNWDECVSFYKNIVGLPIKIINKDIGWVEFDLGGVTLAIERQDENETASQNLVGRFIGFSIQVEDVELIYQELASKGVEFEGLPEWQPWGGVLAHFKDPDKNIITLVSLPNT